MKPLAKLKQFNSYETDIINHMFIVNHPIDVSDRVYDEWFKQFGIVKTHHRDNGLSLYFDTQDSYDKFMSILDYHKESIPLEYFDKYPDDMIESEFQKLYNLIDTEQVKFIYCLCIPENKRVQLKERFARDVDYSMDGIQGYPIDENCESDPENEHYAG